jgi:uroporphyrinogen decarboxylase
MNSLDRVLAALRREEPNRVPIVEFVIDPNVAKAAVPESTDTADCADRLDTDAVSCRALFAEIEKHSDGTWIDEWGVTYARGRDVFPHPIRGPIASFADLRRYRPPAPDAPGRLGLLPDLVRRYKGRRAILFAHRAAFIGAAYLHGLDNLLANFLLEPEFAHALLDMVLDVNIRIARSAVRAGADVIVLGDDYADNRGPMMSPALFGEFILPRLTRMVKAVHEEGGFIIKHSDGNLYPIIEAIASSGADALNPIEPAAGMDLATSKGLVGDRMAIMGNVDCGQLLPLGTPDQVRESVRQCMRDAAPGGGYLLSSSNSIHSGVKPENWLAMIEAGREFGKHP